MSGWEVRLRVILCVCARARVCLCLAREKSARRSWMDGWMDGWMMMMIDSIGVSKSNHVKSSSVST